MSSSLTVMSSFLVAVICLTVLTPYQARAAVCPQHTPFRCQATDYTLPTCNNATLECDCKPGYSPIPTGCAVSLQKPAVNVDDSRRTAQFLPGAEVRLTCSTGDTGSLVFQWIKDGVIVPGQTTSLLSLTGNDEDKMGNFSCITRDTTVNFTSEASDKKEIFIVTTELAAKVVPIVTVLPQTAATGVKLDVQCTNIPYGATFTFKLTPGDTTVDTVTQESAFSDVTCVLDDVNNLWTKKESAAAKLPTNATEITKVTIIPSTMVTYKTGTSVTYTCVTEPEAKYLESATNVTYTFKDSLVTTLTTSGNSYTIISTPGAVTTRTVSCGATWGKQTEKPSAPVTVIFSDSYIKTPTVKASSTEVHTGAALVLTCDTEVGITYTWLKDGKRIARQADRIIQVGKFQPADAGKYVCTAQKNAYIASSPELVVKSGAAELRVLASTVTVLIAGITGRLLLLRESGYLDTAI